MSLHFRLTAALLAAVVAGLSSQAVAADGYGDLTGRIVFDGDVPKLLPKVKKRIRRPNSPPAARLTTRSTTRWSSIRKTKAFSTSSCT